MENRFMVPRLRKLGALLMLTGLLAGLFGVIGPRR